MFIPSAFPLYRIEYDNGRFIECADRSGILKYLELFYYSRRPFDLFIVLSYDEKIRVLDEDIKMFIYLSK